MFCSKCGANIADNSAFCPACGNPTQQAAQPQTSSQYTPPAPQVIQGQPVYAAQQPIQGLGGWLILVAIFLILSVLGSVDNLVSLDQAVAVGFGGPMFMISHILTLALSGLALYFFFTKSRHFPPFFIFFNLAGFVLIFLALSNIKTNSIISDLGGMSADNFVMLLGILCQGITAAIFIPYTLMSKRVKNTFVN